jgi:ribose transport system ATP-binding protein
MSSSTLLLEMRGIRKDFPGVQALRDASLELRAGEVLALVGENGAGKSTLMKVLGGILRPEGGEILLDGRRVELSEPRAARALGIRLIHQELFLCPNLDVAGNVFLGEERGPEPRPLSLLPRKRLATEARAWMERVGLDLPPSTPVRRLSPGQMQMVEIAKALAGRARLLVMDEPTSSLTLGEAERLFAIIGELRAAGLGIIYITHRLEEVFRVSDRITVLRDGRRAGDLVPSSATHDAVVSMMVGRELKSWFPERKRPPGEVYLRVEGLRVPGAAGPVSFEARRGEILGFAGLVGSGRTELMQALFGSVPARGGAVWIGGQRAAIRRPRQAIERGIFLAPEDRKLHGLVLSLALEHNLTLPGLKEDHPLGLLRPRMERQAAQAQVERLGIKTPSLRQKTVNLSGGNQQKAVLGKWLALEPRVLILDEPTRGVDVGARAEIYRHMAELADRGLTILMVSSDLEEVIGLSDRVAVMHARAIAGFLGRGEINEEAIMNLAVGRPPRAAG